METHLYSKRKCLLFSCTICQRTFVCLFYYCLYNSFLFIEHSSMSVKCLFFLSERAKSFLYVKREQSSMYWAIEKYKQMSTNNFLDKLIEIGKHEHTHILRTFVLSHLSTMFICSLMVHVTVTVCCFYIGCQSMNVTVKYHTSIFILHRLHTPSFPLYSL